jgi:hypothetical protein
MTHVPVASWMPTADFGEVFYVPPEGVLQVFQKEVEPHRLLTGPGKYVVVHVGKNIHAHFRATDDGAPNPRATTVLVGLTEVHMGFTGPVVFDGLTGDRIYELIQQLSKEGT